MKKYFCLIICLCFVFFGKAQTLDVACKFYGNNGASATIIKPTIKNFKILLSLEENEFIVLMNRYNYKETNSFGKYRCFENGSLDYYIENCANFFNYNVFRKEIWFLVSVDMVYPKDVITALYRDLKLAYIDTEYNKDGVAIDLFAFMDGEYVFEFHISNASGCYHIHVFKKHKSEYKN